MLELLLDPLLEEPELPDPLEPELLLPALPDEDALPELPLLVPSVVESALPSAVAPPLELVEPDAPLPSAVASAPDPEPLLDPDAAS